MHQRAHIHHTRPTNDYISKTLQGLTFLAKIGMMSWCATQLVQYLSKYNLKSDVETVGTECHDAYFDISQLYIFSQCPSTKIVMVLS